VSDGIARFKDFTGDPDPIQFKIRDEVFTALDDIPLAHMGRLAELGEDLGSANATEKFLTLFSRLLVPESYARFEAAVKGESATVIGVSRVKEIIPWLLEQYGLRPTVAPSGSSTTSEESGESSTDGALLAAVTS